MFRIEERGNLTSVVFRAGEGGAGPGGSPFVFDTIECFLVSSPDLARVRWREVGGLFCEGGLAAG